MIERILNLKNDILKCFEIKTPHTIIVGGSYSTNESCSYRYKDSDLWLSDFDLLCIHPEGYTSVEKEKIYTNMLELSMNVPQLNPYFHIGLKMRSPQQLKKELDSLYFIELSVKSYKLIGNEFNSFFEPNEKIGFDYLDITTLNKKLYAWGLTRLWCNILFFPVKFFDVQNHILYKFWYNYFFARGAMDWITFDLIQKQFWDSSYERRFDMWNKLSTNSIRIRKAFQCCFDIKMGITMVNIEPVFKTINDYSFTKLLDFKDKSSVFKIDSELEFLKYMLLILESEMKIVYHDRNELLINAKKMLEITINSDISYTSDKYWDRWSDLRSVYSKFRFSRNPIDKYDHNVYTKYFLELGKEY